MKNDQIDVYDLIEKVAENSDAKHTVNFLKQIVHEQSESDWKRIDAFEKEYDKIYKRTFSSVEKPKKSARVSDSSKSGSITGYVSKNEEIDEEENENYDTVETGVYSSE